MADSRQQAARLWAAQETPAIYLDHAATSPLDPAIGAEMLQVGLEDFGNPSSRHRLGLAAEQRLRHARRQVARRLGLTDRGIVFTSGATEALALAMLGTARQQRRPGHVLISAIEHPSARETAFLLARDGHQVEEFPVEAGGRVDLAGLAAKLRPQTFLVVLMHVNNEIGVVQPVGRAARLVKRERPRCRVVVDMVQSFGLLETDVTALGADLVAVSAHKIHGPKGVGCLGIADGVPLAPLWGGGDQERGLQSGTENVPGIVGLGLAAAAGKGDPARLSHQVDRLWQAVQEARPDAVQLGDQRHRAPNILALGLPGLRGEVVVNALSERGLFVSSGSACHSRRSLRSRVLTAMGVDEDLGVIRLSIGRLTDDLAIERAAEILRETLPGL